MDTHIEPGIQDRRKIAAAIRSRSLRMVHDAKLGHPGGDLSAADILVALHFGALRGDPDRTMAPGRDRFVLSKGHCACALYSTLSAAGYFPEELLNTFAQPLSRLNGHPDRNKLPGVEANTGPLGHGMPIATGLALAAKISGASWRTFIRSDGDCRKQQ